MPHHIGLIRTELDCFLKVEGFEETEYGQYERVKENPEGRIVERVSIVPNPTDINHFHFYIRLTYFNESLPLGETKLKSKSGLKDRPFISQYDCYDLSFGKYGLCASKFIEGRKHTIIIIEKKRRAWVFDRIKDMDIDEFANWLIHESPCGNNCTHACPPDRCKEAIKKHLSQEAPI